MAIFRAMHGPTPSLDLTTDEKLVLAIGGTLGVVGFVAVPTVALLRSGFRLRATLGAVDRKLRRLLWLSAWVALQPDVAVLLAAALVMGNQVAGGVVAYQFCFVAFLAPYAILAMPIHTTILPELTVDAGSGDMAAFAGRLRWGLDGMSRLLLPVSAAFVALALPAMRVLAVGNSRHDADLFAAVLASLGVGLFTYGTFLFFARASYALGDSRTPAIIAGSSALVGAAVMVIGGLAFEQRHRQGRGARTRTQRGVPRGHARVGHGAAQARGPRVLPARVPSRARGVGCARWSGVAGRGSRGPERQGRRHPRARRDRCGRPRHLPAAPAHAPQAGRPARAGVRTDRSRPRGRAVSRRLAAAHRGGRAAGVALLAAPAAAGAQEQNASVKRVPAHLASRDVVGRRAVG